jgi:HlyD family secretion protein
MIQPITAVNTGFCMKFISTGPLAGRKTRLALALAALVAIGVFFFAGSKSEKPAETPAETTKAASAKPALTVSLVTPEKLDWPQVLPANGSVVAWQEAVIGPEISNYRITEVNAFRSAIRSRKARCWRVSPVIPSTANWPKRAPRSPNCRPARRKPRVMPSAPKLKAKGFYSATQYQYQTAEHMALARLAAAKARQQAAELKLSKTNVLAPDDGVISARSAVVGSLTQPGRSCSG